MGPFLFSLGILDTMKSCRSGLSLWYLDDATLAGDPETVLEDLDKIIDASDSLGLYIKPSKCELFFTKNYNSEDHQAVVNQLVARYPK